MSDSLTPLRHVYGVEPVGPVPAPGEPGHVELTLLRTMREALDAHPTPAPEAAATTAVHDYAASPEVALLRSTAEALDHAVRAGDRSPDADVLAAVLARASEGALLTPSLDALAHLPAAQPDADVVARVLAHAEAADPLAAVRHVHADGPAPSTEAGAVEVALLRQSGEIVDRANRSRPQPRPAETAVAAVLARAAEASSLDAAPAHLGATSPVEAALVDQSLAALDRLPSVRPEAATVTAVLTHAASATPSAQPARRAPDRAAVRPERRRRTGVWAGAGGLLVAALVAVVTLPSLLTSEADLAPEAAQLVAPDAVAEVADVSPDAPADTEAAEVPLESSPGVASNFAASAAIAAAVPPVVARRAPSDPTASGPSPAPEEALVQRAAASVPASVPPNASVTQADLAFAEADEPAPVPAWEAGDDVRTLSLRLQEMDRETQGLAWDAPTEVRGQPALSSPAATPGIQAVREGAAPPPARPDSTRQQR